jgi:protein-S-isoprenylcysteine O-methyltransferase Ste14
VNKSKAIIASYVGVLVFASPLFLGAWKIVFWPGILYVGLAIFGTTINHLLTPPDSDLTARRASEAGAGEAWDKRLLGLYFLLNLIVCLVGGLDAGRFGWSGPVPPAATIIGAAIVVAGQVVFALAKRQNQFFSSTVRIQMEHGHRVCDTGLYAVVRHPGYLGMLVSLLAFPFVLSSYWAAVPTVAAAAVLLVRTTLEDRFLVAGLAGYGAYAARTRWRLVPGLF